MPCLNSNMESVRLQHICYQEWPKHHSFQFPWNCYRPSTSPVTRRPSWNWPWWLVRYFQPKSPPWHSYIFCIFKEHTGAIRKWFFLQIKRWSVRNAKRRGSWGRWSTRTPGRQEAPTTQHLGQPVGAERWGRTSCWHQGKIVSILSTQILKSAESASRRCTRWTRTTARSALTRRGFAQCAATRSLTPANIVSHQYDLLPANMPNILYLENAMEHSGKLNLSCVVKMLNNW